MILAQHTLFDPSRAPDGKHTAWAYCHVPNGWRGDLTDADRGAGRALRARVSASSSSPGAVTAPADFEARNRNLVGGDLNGGTMDLGQLLTRPARRLNPYRTPLPGRLPLLVGDAARRRRPRDVRLFGRAGRAQGWIAAGSTTSKSEPLTRPSVCRSSFDQCASGRAA